DGGGEPQPAAQEDDGDAASRRPDLRRRGARPRAREPRGAAGQARSRDARAGREDREQIAARGQDRQGSVLPPARNAARRGLRLHQPRHDREHAGARCRRRHRRVSREARAEMGGTMIRSFFCWGLLALALGAAAPAQAQGYALIGAWRCHGASRGAQVVYDVVFNADGYYSGTYVATNGFRSYSEGPYRLAGNLLRIDFQVWETQPQPSANPGGDAYHVQFRGGEAMTLLNARCAQNPDCQFSCQRHR